MIFDCEPLLLDHVIIRVSCNSPTIQLVTTYQVLTVLNKCRYTFSKKIKIKSYMMIFRKNWTSKKITRWFKNKLSKLSFLFLRITFLLLSHSRLLRDFFSRWNYGICCRTSTLDFLLHSQPVSSFLSCLVFLSSKKWNWRNIWK